MITASPYTTHNNTIKMETKDGCLDHMSALYLAKGNSNIIKGHNNRKASKTKMTYLCLDCRSVLYCTRMTNNNETINKKSSKNAKAMKDGIVYIVILSCDEQQ